MFRVNLPDQARAPVAEPNFRMHLEEINSIEERRGDGGELTWVISEKQPSKMKR